MNSEKNSFSTPVIDVHVHPKRKNVLILDEILNLMDKFCIRISVLLGRDTDPNNIDKPEIRRYIIERLTNSPLYDRFGIDDALHLEELLYLMKERLARVITNSEIAGYVRHYPQRFIGMGSIDLSKSSEYVDNKIKEIIKLGLAGAKFWPQLQFFNPATSENFRLVAERFSKAHKIIMVHTGTAPGPWEIPELSEYARPSHLELVAQEFDVPILVAHFGYYSATVPGIWFKEALELGKKHNNIYFDVSAVTYILNNEKYVKLIREYVGFDRVLFGSDYLEYLETSIKMIYNSHLLRYEEKEKILGLNALELFNIKI
ncbi:MAG: amidohydrolase family protein [Nitrososphaeria archaeon]